MADQNSQAGCGCACGGGPTLIFACSGAADVGAVVDQAARRLTAECLGKMYCTVGLGGRIPAILETTAGASTLLALDGCPLHCARHSLAQAGFDDPIHVCIADLDMKKGQTPPTEENIERVAAYIREILA